MNITLIYDLKCTNAGKIKEGTNKKGEGFTYRVCSFEDGNIKIEAACVFADENGDINSVKFKLDDIREGDVYRVSVKRYYDKDSNTYKEFFKLV